MVSFRYHVVTIVAVFLALGLGVIAGTTVLDQTLVSQLRAATERSERDVRALEAELARVREETGDLDQWATQIRPHLVSGRLTDQSVLLVTHEGVDPASVTEARTSLVDAGASVQELQVNSGMSATDDGSRQALADALGMDPSTPADELVPAAATALAERLAGGAPTDIDGQPEPDLLESLLQAQLVSMPGIEPPDLAEVGGPDQADVVVAGGAEEPSALVDEFMIPLARDLHTDHPEELAAAGESTGSVDPFVTTLREDPGFSTEGMVTVDDLDPEHFGGVTLVLALERLIETGIGGDFGTKDGADDLVPDPVAT